MAKITYLDKGISAMQPNIDSNQQAVAETIGVQLVEEKCLGYINLRLQADDTQSKGVVKKILGVELPAINQTSHNDEYTVLGFSPNEWLIITSGGSEMVVMEVLIKKLGDVHSLVTDISGGMTKLTVSGANAQDLLEKGTYVDLHDSVFKAGDLYATQIAHAPAVIVKNGSQDFSLFVRRSFANHIANWAIDGAQEYGFSFI